MQHKNARTRGNVQPGCLECHRAWQTPAIEMLNNLISHIFCLPTWKFFSAQPFLARARTITSASTSLTTPSTQVVISSNAANLVFQLASPKSVKILDGMRSAESASASSGVCLYLNESKAPDAGAAPPLAGLDVGAAAAGTFLTAVGALATAGGFLAYS